MAIETVYRVHLKEFKTLLEAQEYEKLMNSMDTLAKTLYSIHQDVVYASKFPAANWQQRLALNMLFPANKLLLLDSLSKASEAGE